MGQQNAVASGNDTDNDYDDFLQRFRMAFSTHIENGAKALFTTDAEGLWDAYLQGFPAGVERQHHNCNACRHFIERYASLVTIDESGLIQPAFFRILIGAGSFPYSFRLMEKLVRRANVTGVFLSSDAVLGTPVTGIWRHLSVTLHKSMLHSRVTQTAGQAIAEKKEDFLNVTRALSEYSLPVLEQALTLLQTESIYRSEKVVGPVKWLRDLLVARNKAHHKANVVWRAIATAPAGFCHPRASMVGTLLDDIASGMDFAEVSRRFAAKMNPQQYQRPKAAPAAGAIAQAEEIVSKLGAAGSLARRFARVEEIPPLWAPCRPAGSAQTSGGVFGHLKPKPSAPQINAKAPPITMTWEKFQRTVLPDAQAIEFLALPQKDNYTALITAVNPDAPPILQWDSPWQRNPVSWYVWHGGSRPEQFGLSSSTWHPVSAVTLKPSMWSLGPFEHHGAAVIFIIEGARDTKMSGAALFPEILKSEFHGVSTVIEAYSRSAKIEGRKESTACGIMLQKGTPWHSTFRVTTNGQAVEYRLDRWD